MFKNRSEYLTVIDRISNKMVGELKPIFKINTLFIVNIQLSYQLHMAYAKGTIPDLSSYKQRFTHQLKGKAQIVKSLKKLIIQLPKLFFFIFYSKFSKIDVLYVGYKTNNLTVNGVSQNQYLQPIAKENLTKKNMFYYFDGNIDKDWSKKSIEFLFDWYTEFYKIRLFLSKGKKLALLNLGNIINKYLFNELGKPIKGFDNFIADKIIEYKVHTVVYKKILKKIKPQSVLGYCYYDNRTNAMFSAAKKLKINTIEYQHSSISNNHFAYSNWDNIDEISIHFPSEFYVWNENDKLLIENNFKGIEYKPKIKVKGIKHLNQVVKKAHIADDKLLICLQGLWMPNWLENFIINDDNHKWFIRLHPRYPNDKIQLSKIQELRKTNIYIEEANNSSLDYLLGHSKALITCFSGTAIEAHELGLKVFIYGKEGKATYYEYIEKGLFTYLKNSRVLEMMLSDFEIQ